MRTWLIIALLTAVALSGCASEEPTDATTVDDTTTDDGGNKTTDPDTGNETGGADTGNETDDGNQTGEDAVNTPPLANITADVINGTTPLNVTFTLDGSDADGDDLSWTFDADGDGAADEEGTALPATVNFTYMANGTFNATLSVSDGSNATVATVGIVASAEAGPVVQTASGEWLVDNPYWTGDGAAILEEDAFPEELEGITYASFEVDSGTYGQPFFAKYGCNAQGVDGIAFYDADGNRLLRASDIDEGEICEIAGVVPEGAVTGYFYSAGGGDSVEYATPA